MLNFLRKYQRYFFILITVAIIISFTFFGTYSTFLNQTPIPDKELHKGVAGKPILQLELTTLCRLIETSPFDQAKGGMPNFFNDGVIEKDFLSTGLAVMLCKRYFDPLREDLNQRVKKIHRYRPYVHPQTSEISSEKIWARFSPKLLEHFRALKGKSDQATADTLPLMTQLYLEQAMLPPEMLRQLLSMQQNQQGISPDPVLANADLTLFGFKSLSDWFGPRFISLVGQFILNAAQLAEEKGYSVTTEEVRADLYQNIYTSYQHISKNKEINSQELSNYFEMKMRQMGMDESMLLTAWRKVILFRRLFEDGSGSVLMDPLVYRHFDQFAKENARICLYQLPAPLQLADFRTMLKMQVYLESVAADPSRLRIDLHIPRQFASLEQIEKRFPALVERTIEVEYTTITKEELARGISIKETGEWEVSDPHWALLQNTFPSIASLQANTHLERLALLDRLDPKVRIKIDQYARCKMIEQQPTKIQFALENALSQTRRFGLRAKDGEFPFLGVKNKEELATLLMTGSLRGEVLNSANEKLQFYTADQEHYYQISILSRANEKKVLTFQEAVKDGTLDTLLDQKLEEVYPDVRKKEASIFQNSHGQWKPYKEVRDQIGKRFYADLLRSIEESYRIQYGFLPGKAGELPLSFYSNARFLSFMKEAHKHLQVHPEDAAWIQTDATANGSFATQWLLEKAEKVMERRTETSFSKEEMFTLAPKAWSSVNVGEKGAIAFYFIQEKGVIADPSLESVEQGHQILSFDAKKDMMLQLMDRMEQKKAIDFNSIIAEEGG